MDLEFELEDDTPVLVPLAFDRSMRSFDKDGHMRVESSNISKACVNPYIGREIPNHEELRLDPNKIYMLYRDATELQAAANSYENKPLMMEHIAVSADQPQKHFIVGTISNVRFQHPYLKASLAVWDKKAIEAIESGEQEQLSCGYRYRADMSPGEIDGVKYDGVMRELACNHVALVHTGRAGPDVLVSDELPSNFLDANMKISALVDSLKPFLAADAKPADITAAVTAQIALDKKDAEDKAAKDNELGKGAETAIVHNAGEDDEMDLEGEDKDCTPEEKAAKDAARAAKDKKPKAMDSATVQSVVNAALTARDALHVARREVEPILGVVAYDSAADVYKAALVKLGVAVDGIDPSAYKAILGITVQKSTTAQPLAQDGGGKVLSMAEAFPGFNRIK